MLDLSTPRTYKPIKNYCPKRVPNILDISGYSHVFILKFFDSPGWLVAYDIEFCIRDFVFHQRQDLFTKIFYRFDVLPSRHVSHEQNRMRLNTVIRR